MLAEAGDEEVLAFCGRSAAEMAAHGTTALELKSGYGLSVEGELRQLRLARRLAEARAADCTVTLLACHAVPDGLDARGLGPAACDELIPAAAAEGLADAVDIYVEDIAFSLDDLARVAAAASDAGLPLECHADQLGPSGAAEAAVALGARERRPSQPPERCRRGRLGPAPNGAVLLPASTFFLRRRRRPSLPLRDAGAALAIATDLNPEPRPSARCPRRSRWRARCTG